MPKIEEENERLKESKSEGNLLFHQHTLDMISLFLLLELPTDNQLPTKTTMILIAIHNTLAIICRAEIHLSILRLPRPMSLLEIIISLSQHSSL